MERRTAGGRKEGSEEVKNRVDLGVKTSVNFKEREVWVTTVKIRLKNGKV